MHSRKTTRRLNFLITAGGTREYIDPVRFISNASSGKMGYELAKAAQAIGHNVTLITTIRNTTRSEARSLAESRLPRQGPLRKYEIRNTKIRIALVDTADEMFRAVKSRFDKCDCLIMAAAVSDYTPVKTSRLKIRKSNRLITLKLKPTPDILKWAGLHKHKGQVVVGFALEDRDLKANAERKMRDKNLDMVVANTPLAIGSEQSEIFVKVVGQKWLRFGREPKRRIARRLISLIQSLIPRSSLVNSDSNL